MVSGFAWFSGFGVFCLLNPGFWTWGKFVLRPVSWRFQVSYCGFGFLVLSVTLSFCGCLRVGMWFGLLGIGGIQVLGNLGCFSL